MTEWNIEGELGQQDSPAWKTVFAAARELGQVESSTPANQYPDYLLIPGGANMAPRQRLQYGLETVKDFGVLVYAGSSRLVPEDERRNASSYPGESYEHRKELTEFDIGCAAFEKQLKMYALLAASQ